MSLNRRQFIAGGAAAAAAVGGARIATADTDPPQPLRGDEGATILGPRNEPLERENSDALAPPTTDAGQLPNLKFSFDAAHTRIGAGGWARQVTTKELPIATTIAGVDMRLKPGGFASCTGTPTPTSGCLHRRARADDRLRGERDGEHVRLPGR